MQNEKREKHPSYGLISVSRCHGGSQQFFGSQLKDQPGFITLKIDQGESEFSLGHTFYYGKKHLFEVKMTYAQWAELLSSFNIAPGVPCTITFNGKEYIDPPPLQTTDVEKVRASFQNQCNNVVRTLDRSITSIRSIIEKKTLNKNDRKVINNALCSLRQEVASNIPFLLESLEESAGKVITHAKTEIDGFWQMVIRSAGLKSLEKSQQFLLNKKEEDNG